MTDAAEPTPDDATEGEPLVEADPASMHGVPVTRSRGQLVLHPTREGYHDLVRALIEDEFDLFMSLTAVDYLTHSGRPLPEGMAPERFEVVVELVSMTRRQRARLRVQVPEHDAQLPTLYSFFPGSEAHERETYDMFGIRFEGHPDLTRILMPEDWEGHPLRKDYPVGRIPVQFKGAPGPR